MKKPNFATEGERRAYELGQRSGYREGLHKAIMSIQLLATDTQSFKEGILQNSPESIKLREIFTK